MTLVIGQFLKLNTIKYLLNFDYYTNNYNINITNIINLDISINNIMYQY